MMISIKKGTCSFSLICLKILSIGLAVITAAPIEAQQALAKLQHRKKCVTVSSFWRMHRSYVLVSSSIFSLLRRSHVLNLSLISSQKKTLCFI
jgi:hypothetical protein